MIHTAQPASTRLVPESGGSVKLAQPDDEVSTPLMKNIRTLSARRALGLLASLFTAATLAGPAPVEDPLTVAAQLEQSRKINEAKREATIAANVAFTLEEKSAFWPVYWEYRGKVNEVDDAYARIIEEYATKYQAMDDRSALRIVDEWLQVEADRHALKAEYIKHFQSVLPPAKALRVFQIENKLDVMISADLGKRLPLSEPDG